ncbi:TPA: hypothetical protein ACHU7Y_003228, partial [Shigella flexneri]
AIITPDGMRKAAHLIPLSKPKTYGVQSPDKHILHSFRYHFFYPKYQLSEIPPIFNNINEPSKPS